MFVQQPPQLTERKTLSCKTLHFSCWCKSFHKELVLAQDWPKNFQSKSTHIYLVVLLKTAAYVIMGFSYPCCCRSVKNQNRNRHFKAEIVLAPSSSTRCQGDMITIGSRGIISRLRPQTFALNPRVTFFLPNDPMIECRLCPIKISS